MSSYQLWVERDGELHVGPVTLTEGDVFTVVVPDLDSLSSVELAVALRECQRINSELHSRLWECEHHDDD